MYHDPIGYMLTWTTYGSRLQGDPRGYVKDGRLCSANTALHRINQTQMQGPMTTLSHSQQTVIAAALRHKAAQLGHDIPALSVGCHHVHLVLKGVAMVPEEAVKYYKNATRLAVKNDGFTGRLWKRGFVGVTPLIHPT